jgi:predicted nucleic acid-binding protein
MNQQVDIIPGIYNHCDTWCERCLFTSRCRSFQIQAEAGLVKLQNSESDIITQLTDALNLTKQYMDKLTQHQEPTGDDAPSDAQAHSLEEEPVRNPNLTFYPVTPLANQYLRQTGQWLKEEKLLLEQTGRQQIQEVALGIRTEEEAMAILNALKDAWEMIRWYRTLIPVKIQSALRALNNPTDDTLLNTYHLGKAKLVLVSADRSVLAWQTMIEYYPEKTDDLLDLLVLLSRIRQEMERLFPDARAFQRPGLD